MGNAENGRMKVESGTTPFAMAELTVNTAGTQYASGNKLWSRNGSAKPTVLPNGVVSGGLVTPGAGNDAADVEPASVNLNGVVESIPSATVTVVRATPADTHSITSIYVDGTTKVFTALAGTDGTSFSEVRGAAGGPPAIPVDGVEVAQVRLASNVAAPVAATGEIFAVSGTHREDANFPNFAILSQAGIVQPDEPYGAVHTGGARRKVFAQYNTAILTPVFKVQDVTMPNITRSVTSEATTDGPSASSTSTLNAGTFTMIAANGITDLIMQLKDKFLWVQWQPDRDLPEKHQVQGFINPVASFGPESNTSISVSVTPEEEGFDLAA